MVSIIVPYNKDRGYLSMCMESIENQTYPCKLILSQSPESVVYNFNRGLELVKTEFVKVVGEDDWLPLDSVENLVNGIGDAPWICANAINVSGAHHEVYKPDTLEFSEMVKLNRVHGGGTMYRTDILREIGGMDESLWTAEEYDMNLKLMSLGYLPKYLDKSVYFYRQHDKQKSNTLRKSNRKKRANEIARIQNLYR